MAQVRGQLMGATSPDPARVRSAARLRGVIAIVFAVASAVGILVLLDL